MTNSKTRLVIVLAAFGLIANACSRSGGGGSTPIQTAPPPVATPIQKTELDGHSGKSSQDDKEVGADDRDDARIDTSGKGSPNDDAPVTDVDGVVHDDTMLDYDPTGKTPEQIYSASEALGPAVVGRASGIKNGDSGEMLFYSGSGQDNLRSQLQDFVQSKASSSHGARDAAFAKSLVQGTVDVDWNTRVAKVRIATKRSGKTQTLTFSGELNNKLILRAGLLTSGDRVRIEAACMDLAGGNDGCQTFYVKVQDASSGTVDTAHMLLRHSRAALFTRAKPGYGAAKNAEFDRLLAVLDNTSNASGRPGALSKLMLRTSETIGGSASYRVEMQILTKQRTLETLNLGGKLVKKATDIKMAGPAQVMSSTSLMADTVRNVVLSANDGRGDLTLDVTVRKAVATASEDTMNLTIARIYKPVRRLILL